MDRGARAIGESSQARSTTRQAKIVRKEGRKEGRAQSRAALHMTNGQLRNSETLENQTLKLKTKKSKNKKSEKRKSKWGGGWIDRGRQAGIWKGGT